MTEIWLSYLVYCTVGLLIAGAIIGPNYIFNLRHYATVFLGLMYVTFVLRPVLAFTIGEGLTLYEMRLPGISLLVTKDTVPMALLFSASLIFFAFGYRQYSRSVFSSSLDQKFHDSKTNVLLVRYALFLILVGYFSFLFSERGFSSPSTAEYVRTSGGTGYSNTTGYIESANYLVVSGVLLYYAVQRRLFWSLVLVMPWLYSQIYFGWARFMFLTFALGLFSIWLIRVTRNQRVRRQTILIVILVLSGVILLISMRANRDFLQKGSTPLEAARKTSQLPVDQLIGDFSGFEGSWYMFRALNYREPRYGASLIYQFIVKPIPRIIWSGKPYPADFTWGTIFGYSTRSTRTAEMEESTWYTGPVKGAIGEAIAEWGLFGIPVNFFLTGLFLAWMERRLSVSKSSPLWLAAYGTTYGMLSLLARDSIFNNQISTYLLFFYAPYVIINWGIKHSSQVNRNAVIRYQYSYLKRS